MTVFHHMECRNGEKRKRCCAGRLVLDLHGIKSNCFTLFRPHLSHSHVNGSPPPRQPTSNRDCFLPHGVDAQCKMHAIWWTFDAGISWDQIQSLSPQVATFPQSTGTWFPLLACCHNTYIELIPWHRTSDCQHATSCCHPFGEELVFKCLKMWFKN